MDPIRTILKMSNEERETYLKSLDKDTLLAFVIPYFDKRKMTNKLHSVSVSESQKKKRKFEQMEAEFRSDWDTVKNFWMEQDAAATTIRNYRTTHTQWAEVAATAFPDTPVDKLLVELVNNPDVIEEYISSAQRWASGTKADRLKYLLNLNDKYTNFKNHTSVDKVSLIRDMYEYYTLVAMEEKCKEPPSLDPVMSYSELEQRVVDLFGLHSLENLFIKTMLEIPVRSDLSTMVFYRDEEDAKQEGKNWIVVPVDETLPAKFCLNHFKTQKYAERYITSGELSMELTKLLQLGLQRATKEIVEDQKGVLIFPTPRAIGKFVQDIGERVGNKLTIHLLRHMLQRNAKENMSPEAFAQYNRRMLHSMGVAINVYMK